jgi:sialate O-acetylesterase
MKIVSGLTGGQVLQRLGPMGADAVLRGTGPANGPVRATLSKGSVALKGWKQRPVGHTVRGKFTLKLRSIPAGGPYHLRLEAGQEEVEVKSFFVGDVWVMAGQSNMQGIGNMTHPAKPHLHIRNFSMRREWRLAEDPLHLLTESPDTCHTPVPCSAKEGEKQRRDALKGVGVGIFFAREMLRRSGGVPQGLISTAHGGTSMQQWSPDRKKLGGASLYASMLMSVRATGQPVAGVLWYQGESDTNPADSAVYIARMKKLVAATRRDFGQPKLPWMMVQIGRFFVDGQSPVHWNRIQELQRTLPDKIKFLETVPTVDLSMDDAIHIGSHGFPQLALRLASAADRLVYKNKKGLRPPQLRGASLVDRPTRPAPMGVEVIFDHVEGGLRSVGEPNGFQFVSPEGTPLNLVFKTTLKGNKVLLHLDKKMGLGNNLFYGHGFAPYCNITDARGFSLPVFGPLPLGDSRPRAILPFILQWNVTALVPAPAKLDQVQLAAVKAMTATAKDYTTYGFVNEHPQWEGKSGQMFFHSRFRLDEPMKLEFMMGYDGPFRLWLDGKPFFVDMKGINPCFADESSRTSVLQPGTHDLTVGMDTNSGLAWGYFLRVARRDIRKAQVESGGFVKPVFFA